jgi:hypothetical protein
MLLAWAFSTASVERKLAGQVKEKLAAAGANWASVELDGRDLALSGTAPSRGAAQKARQVALGVFGVRRVDDSRVKVALAAPTVNPARANAAPLTITGEWKKAPGVSLAVTIAGKTYELGKDPELTTDDSGRWTLKLTELPPDGTHDIKVETVENGTRVADATSNELVIDTTPPAAPTVNTVTLPEGTGSLTGTIAPDTKVMRVTVAGKTYELGKDPELTAAGAQWVLKLPSDLAVATYDVVVEVADAAGNHYWLVIAADLAVRQALYVSFTHGFALLNLDWGKMVLA